jgi:hypothetical protein
VDCPPPTPSLPHSHFTLCHNCFSSGVELHPHSRTHRYRVSECLQRPLFSKDWTAHEDLTLLAGIDKCGLGNWKLVSDFMGSKNARACDEHYWDLYMGRFGRCLPHVTYVMEWGSGGVSGGVSGVSERVSERVSSTKAVETSRLLVSAAPLLAPDLKDCVSVGVSVGGDEKSLVSELLRRQEALVNIPPPEATATRCSTVGSVVERFEGE